MDSDFSSRRSHERVVTRGKIEAVVSYPILPDQEGQEYSMEILEVSPAGMRIRSAEPVTAENIDLVAKIDGYAGEIFLSTWVRWQEQDAEGYTLFGVEIDDNGASDLDAWCDFQRQEWFRDKVE